MVGAPATPNPRERKGLCVSGESQVLLFDSHSIQLGTEGTPMRMEHTAVPLHRVSLTGPHTVPTVGKEERQDAPHKFTC